jgi:hypothetical protein
MHFKKSPVVAAVLGSIVSLGVASSASAALINIQFGQSNSTVFGGPTAAYAGPAVIGNSGATWNLFTAPFAVNGPFGFSASDQPLANADGTASTATVSYATPDTMIHLATATFTGTPYEGLMNSFMFTDNNRNADRDGPGTVTVKGLAPGGQYRVVLYSAADLVGRGTLLDVNGTSTTLTAAGSKTFVQGENYADLLTTATANGEVLVTIGRAATNSLEGDLNGIQIVAVPEPAWAGMLIGGVTMLVCRRKCAGL